MNHNSSSIEEKILQVDQKINTQRLLGKNLGPNTKTIESPVSKYKA